MFRKQKNIEKSEVEHISKVKSREELIDGDELNQVYLAGPAGYVTSI